MSNRRTVSRRTRLGLGAALAATALVACGGSSDPAPAADDAAVGVAPIATDASAPASPGAAVPAALDFSATLLDGGEIEMGEFAGRPVLLWFWAPW